MIEYSFDIRGFLRPYGKNQLTFGQFRELFVLPFDEGFKRRLIFEEYRQFLMDFREQVSIRFTQWVNGSFISKKETPADIDFVTLIDFEVYRSLESVIDRNFRLYWAKAKYPNLDAFTLKILPEGHENFRFLKYDMQYWEEWFGNSRPNRANRIFPKGFVEIHFDENTNI